jgi:rubrerythrin
VRSRAAVRILKERGFKEVYNLKGGMMAWEEIEAPEVAGSADRGINLIKGNETPNEIVAMAYGMEKGQECYYSTMVELLEDTEVSRLLKELAEEEKNHQQKIFILYQNLDPSVTNRQKFEARLVSDAMEGGFMVEEFVEKNRSGRQSVLNVLNVSMMLEAQALDLYMRYSDRCVSENAKETLFYLAEQEKQHLNRIGSLIEDKFK